MSLNNETFEADDLFNRKSLADKIADLISISEEEGMRESSFVIALNASWGNGKTTFVNKLINKIKNPMEDKYEKLNAIPVYYNAWEEDDYGNAFESLIFRIIEKIETHKNITPDMKKQLIILKNKLPDVLFNIGKSYIKNKLKKHDIEIDEITDLVKTNNELKKLNSNDYFENYQKFKKIKNDFKEILEKLALKRKLIIFIDELDRCRPDFAIETLEIVKHYFDIPNIVFVLSLDIEQLSHSIATCYGQNMDSAGYLRRFIDFQVNIPQAKLKIENFSEFGESNKRDVYKVFEFFNMSLRDLFKLKKDVKFFLDKFGENEITRKLYINLIVIKYKFPNEFKQILYGKESFIIEYIVMADLFNYFDELLTNNTKTIDEIDYKTELHYFKCTKINNNEIISIGQHIENVIEYISISDN